MKKLCVIASIALSAIWFAGCQRDFTTDVADKIRFTASFEQSRTSLGEKKDGVYPVFWSEGDRIVVNAIESDPVEIATNRSKASFTVPSASLKSPYYVTYPYSASTTAETPMVTFKAEQNYIAGSFDVASAPLCAYSTTNNLSLHHLAGVLRFAVRAKSEGVVLKTLSLISETPIAGDFAVDCQAATVAATDATVNTITYTLPENFELSTTEYSYLHVTVPCGVIGATKVVLKNSKDQLLRLNWSGANVAGGIVREFNNVIFGDTEQDATLETMREVGVTDWDFSTDATISGYVKDKSGKAIANVVVSDGFISTQTDRNGYYMLNSALEGVKFVMASIPSGYSAPTDGNGLPIFYKRLGELEPNDGKYTANFTFNKISGDADRFTLLVAADPQPRPRDYEFDLNAYHSLDMCDDLYRDMREKAATITDRKVYGLMLGDIVHENMGLFKEYVASLATLGFPMYNVLGNHDNDPYAANDVEGRRVFEEKLGPTYYSFNIGNVHFVVLDNLIMKLEVKDGVQKLTGTEQGLTDEIMAWLESDLQYVDKSKILMVAAHSPMTKLRTGGSRTNAAKHFADYTALFKKFAQAHIWSGHTHKMFNYNYAPTSSLYPIEEHTVARSTGELWTNEYEAGGAPRGYVVVEVDGNDVSWKFKPTIYQTGSFSYYTSKKPTYTHRDWNYDKSGVAKMKSDGSTLSDSYQMKIYKPGIYHDTFAGKLAGEPTNDYIYVDVFMWDNKWQLPKFNGQEMEHIAYNTAYSLAEYEIINHYYTYGFSLKDYASYEYEYGKETYVHTLFRIKAPSATGSGTITVTDRFGNNYSSSVSW